MGAALARDCCEDEGYHATPTSPAHATGSDSDSSDRSIDLTSEDDTHDNDFEDDGDSDNESTTGSPVRGTDSVFSRRLSLLSVMTGTQPMLWREGRSSNSLNSSSSSFASRTLLNAKKLLLRSKTSALEAGNPAQPQRCGDVKVWPEHWGMTRAQVRELLEELRSDPLWRQENNVYTLVKDFVVPWTAGTGMGLALLLNQEEPREGSHERGDEVAKLQVNVMISHCFGENAEEFLEAVLRATTDIDVVYICAFANYQAEDGYGPSISETIGDAPCDSPFWRVLAHIAEQGKEAGWRWRWRGLLTRLPTLFFLLMVICACWPVMVCSREVHAWWRQSVPLRSSGVPILKPVVAMLCLALCVVVSRALSQDDCVYSGRMVVIPNHQADIYARLWCVYEIFAATTLHVGIEVAPTLAIAGTVSSKHAMCTVQSDELRIRGEIEASVGYRVIDRAVKRTLAGVRWHMFGAWVKYTIIQVLPVCAFVMLVTNNVSAFVVLFVLALFYGVMVIAAYFIARRMRGAVLMSGLPVVLGMSVVVVVGCGLRSLVGMSAMFFGTLEFDAAWTQCLDFALCEIMTVAVAPLVAAAQPSGWLFQRRRILMIIAFMTVFAFGCYMDSHAYGALAEANILFGILLAWARTAPVYMLWTEARHLGITVRRPSGTPKRFILPLAWLSIVVWCVSTTELDDIAMLVMGYSARALGPKNIASQIALQRAQ